MKASSTAAALLMGLGLAGCHSGPTDFIEGTWSGRVIDGDLKPSVTVLDSDTVFTISFYEGQTWDGVELWADVAIDGQLDVYGATVEGEEGDTVTDVHLAEARVLVKPMVGGITLTSRGRFSDDFQELDLDVRFIGELFLDRVDDQPAVEDGDTGGDDDGGGGGIG